MGTMSVYVCTSRLLSLFKCVVASAFRSQLWTSAVLGGRRLHGEPCGCVLPRSGIASPATNILCVDCSTPAPVEGSVRLRGGFGSPCDAIHSGFVEIFHRREWGAICTGRQFDTPQVAGVVCRQLGFPHGTLVDPSVNPADDDPEYYSTNLDDEADEPQERFWLSGVRCRGPEDVLNDCDLGLGFRNGNVGCSDSPSRLTVACRSFAVSEALENVATPGAGASLTPQLQMTSGYTNLNPQHPTYTFKHWLCCSATINLNMLVAQNMITAHSMQSVASLSAEVPTYA